MCEFDDVIQVIGTLSLDFSKLALAKVYSIQHVATTELHMREIALSYQALKKTRKEKERKVLLREKDQEIEAWEQSKLTLAEP